MIYLAGMAVFSGLSLNLLLQFALGTGSVAGDHLHKADEKRKIPVAQFSILFASIIILWLFFKYILPVFWMGFSEFFLFFPLSALVCMGLEFLVERLLPKIINKFGGFKKTFTSITAYDGLIPASLMISFTVARNFLDILILALFFTLGNMVSMLILNEIHRKSALESVPKYIRGSPLILISMGLLSLISASMAGIFFKILGAL